MRSLGELFLATGFGNIYSKCNSQNSCVLNAKRATEKELNQLRNMKYTKFSLWSIKYTNTIFILRFYIRIYVPKNYKASHINTAKDQILVKSEAKNIFKFQSKLDNFVNDNCSHSQWFWARGKQIYPRHNLSLNQGLYILWFWEILWTRWNKINYFTTTISKFKLYKIYIKQYVVILYVF